MTTQIEQRAGKIEASNHRTAGDIKDARDEAEDKRGMRIAKIGAVMAGLTLLLPAPRHEVMNLLHFGGARPNLAALAERNKSVLSVKADPNHPGLDRVEYRYGAYQTGTSYPAEGMAPVSQDGQDLGASEYNLATYPGVSNDVEQGDTIAFDIDQVTGDIVPNPGE